MRLRLVALAALLASCGRGAEEVAKDDAPEGCRIVARDLTLPEDLREASGIAFSRTLDGVLWTHNDSGNQPRLVGIDASAHEVATLPVNAPMRDWEDLAVGPCPEGSCLYMADIGDNGRGRDPVVLDVAAEPATAGAPLGPVRAYSAVFPDGRKHDAEALFVLPGGEVYLISKGTDDEIDLFRWPTPLREGAPATLVHVRRLAPSPSQPGDRVTGASASPDGRFVAVRTYSLVNVYRTADLVGGSATPPSPLRRTDLVPLGEPQGEGVALADDGTVALVSEGHGSHVPGVLSLLNCPLQ
ncbi:MAG: hypothetical protein ICV87_00350 [Gemmatimonadetes bacterium]|nr:hypothetical protein [Gemmatimonadota bacterium]